MTQNAENMVSREELKRILERIRQNEPKVADTTKFTEYNWHKPRHFGIEQISALKVFSEKIAEHIQADLTNLCHGDFRVTATSVTEHFSYTLEKEFYNADQNYYLTFGSNTSSKLQGFAAITKKSALSIVKFMLCEEDSEFETTEPESEGSISNLEESLIYDTAETTLKGLSKTSYVRGGNEFHSTQSLTRGNWPLDLDNLEELCRIDFRIETRSDSAIVSIIIVSELLEPALRIAVDANKKLEADNVQNVIRENLKKVPVDVTAKISTEMLSMQEITSLEPGDVIMLNRPIDEPIDVLVNGTDLMHAFPGICNGKYSMTITHKDLD